MLSGGSGRQAAEFEATLEGHKKQVVYWRSVVEGCKEAVDDAEAALEDVCPKPATPSTAMVCSRAGGLGGGDAIEQDDKFRIPANLPRLVEGITDLETFHQQFEIALYTHKVKACDAVRCLLSTLSGATLPAWAYEVSQCQKLMR